PPNFESTIIAIYAALWNAEYQCRWNKWDFAVKSLDKATEILDNLEEGEEKDVMALDIMSARTLTKLGKVDIDGALKLLTELINACNRHLESASLGERS